MVGELGLYTYRNHEGGGGGLQSPPNKDIDLTLFAKFLHVPMVLVILGFAECCDPCNYYRTGVCALQADVKLPGISIKVF